MLTDEHIKIINDILARGGEVVIRKIKDGVAIYEKRLKLINKAHWSRNVEQLNGAIKGNFITFIAPFFVINRSFNTVI